MATVREAAALMRVSSATIYALCNRGELQSFRVGNQIRIVVSSLVKKGDKR